MKLRSLKEELVTKRARKKKKQIFCKSSQYPLPQQYSIPNYYVGIASWEIVEERALRIECSTEATVKAKQGKIT